jgi:electron transfer flavoprotein alpha/beta subunit
MKIVVCVKQSADGEINPFDASAYETALGIEGAEITLLSMGPEKTAPFLEGLTRLQEYPLQQRRGRTKARRF